MVKQTAPTKSLPRVSRRMLYKYCRWNDHTEAILRDKAVYFCPLKDLNDPLEGRFRIDTEEVRHHYALKYASIKGVSYEEGCRVLADAERDGRVEYGKGVVEAGETIRSSIKILSLSMIHDNIPMWAYYADNHAGICIGFDDTITAFRHALPSRGRAISYVENLTQLDFLAEAPFDGLFQLIFEKTTPWKHEKEYRLVIPDNTNSNGLISPIPANFIKSIYFGYKCDDKTIQSVRAYQNSIGFAMFQTRYDAISHQCVAFAI